MIFSNEKTPFKAITTISSKSKKIDLFPKALVYDFGLELTIFPPFLFLGNIGQENVFYEILQHKNAFLGYKKKEVQKVVKLTIYQRG